MRSWSVALRERSSFNIIVVAATRSTVWSTQDINPRRAGHTLVVPVEEKQRLAELSAESRAALMEGVADAQRRLGKVFDTQDFTVVLHDGPLAGQEVPHVHVHVMPRTKGDGGRCAGMAAFPDAPPIGSVEPDFAALGALSEKLQAA